MSAIRIGTRGSALALAQTQAVANRIAAAAGTEVELVVITTHGDTSTEPLSGLGGTGVFASALREALLNGDCDAVVHSFKDLPTARYPGLVVGATPRRADAHRLHHRGYRSGSPLARSPPHDSGPDCPPAAGRDGTTG